MLTGQKQPQQPIILMDVRLNQLKDLFRQSGVLLLPTCSQKCECRDARERERLTKALKTFHITLLTAP